MITASGTLTDRVVGLELGADGAHALSLLGDTWLRPGWRGIAVPFALAYRPQSTGLGIIAGYLALLLGPSFYLRRRIGARRWRNLHRSTVVVWVMSGVHTLGAGSDTRQLWLQALIAAPSVPIVYLLVLRLLNDDTPGIGRSAHPRAAVPSGTHPARRHRPGRYPRRDGDPDRRPTGPTSGRRANAG
jgi:hypothetical protein